ncbi:hypothetical protein CI109_101939 [Kwoniella shandongensis]|uniref:Uncharacterized protein n=1 Tax=Kwoniella shandongensis TaxID=1734106 RepID=A0A5M6BTY2_9TREE|nr:uncharacterized protein CI109_005401 [Kwoniella shandongensis]KAA5526277.1 hypothetical protein CI109_005401 [Kwoniella shandongensis]
MLALPITTMQDDHIAHCVGSELGSNQSRSVPSIGLQSTADSTTEPDTEHEYEIRKTSMVAAGSLPFARLHTTIFQPNAASPFLPRDEALSPRSSLISPKMLPRRQSRFDPMAREEDEPVDEGYGELKHPLHRVMEESSEHRDSQKERPKPAESISLPGIKSLFGVSADHPPTPSSSALFQSPSLPSLVPNSPSGSPSSARTSRYSSLASSTVPENSVGWWAPEFGDRSSPSHLSPYRSNSFPNTHPYVPDEPDQKRRRSDGPPALRDAEESAMLRWQAQSRNMSYPTVGSPGGRKASVTGSRSLHPPPAQSAAMSAAMSRGSISGSTSGPLSPSVEHPGAPPFSRRPSAASRSSSLVGGQLSRHFADLTAADRSPSVPSPSSEMLPPLQTAPLSDRRSSVMPPPLMASDDSRLLAPLSASMARPPSDVYDRDRLRRQSLTRPPSPEPTQRPELRRSSLTEIIMAKSGDDVAMAQRRLNSPMVAGPSSLAMDKPTFSDSVHPGQLPPQAWTQRRESTESTNGLGLIPDDPLSSRRRKRTNADEVEDVSMPGDPAMSGMDVLAEMANRVAPASADELKHRRGSEDDREDSPSKSGAGGPKYTCAYCAKTFSRPSSLRIHTYSHTGERPYVCKEPSCGRRFSVQSNLKRHAKVHQLGTSAAMAAAASGGHFPPHSHGRSQAPVAPPPHHAMPQPSYHPQAPPGYYPPHPEYGVQPPGPYQSYPDPRFAQRQEQYGPPPLPDGPAGYRSASASRRTSRDGEWSGEGDEEEEEIDELEED